jgi:hypothetical protein
MKLLHVGRGERKGRREGMSKPQQMGGVDGIRTGSGKREERDEGKLQIPRTKLQKSAEGEMGKRG